MDETRGITVKIDAALHAKAKAEQEAKELTMNQYITMVLTEYFNTKGGENMNAATRTMAFQIDEALFQRIKNHLYRTNLTQKSFVIGLIEQAEAEARLTSGDDPGEPVPEADEPADPGEEPAADSTEVLEDAADESEDDDLNPEEESTAE